MNQSKIPLFEALLAHSKKHTVSFHVPGHKNGSIFIKEAKQCYSSLLSLDVTELSGLDDLHCPSGVIKEAEDLTAQFYNCKCSFFLVGGSTVGNLAAIMATCNEGDTVLVQRNSHKSILNGLRLAKVTPVFLQPNFDFNAQIATCLEENHVIDSIKKFSHAKAIIITNPNYYGFTISLKKIVSEAHKNNMVVIVDEAHGAHFGHPSMLLPKSAIDAGADLVVQSAHKTLPAMTMCSYLHYNSSTVDLNKLKYYLQLFQSSSPSYPLMASLDLARYFLASLTEEQLLDTLDDIKNFKVNLNKIPQLKVVESDEYEIDPLKVTIQSQCELSGFELQKILEAEGIFTELADTYNVLLVMPLILAESIFPVVEKIKEKLNAYPVRIKFKKITSLKKKKVTSLAIPYKLMDEVEVELIPLQNSVGRIISEEIIPYPPGIPLLLTGEKIDGDHIKMLNELQDAGAHFQGNDAFAVGVKVFKNT